MAQIIVDNAIFPSKQEAIAHANYILYRKPLDQPLVNADLRFVSALLETHPDRYERLAGNFLSISPTMGSTQQPSISRRFKVIYDDGHEETFSHHAVFNPLRTQYDKIA